MVQSLLFSVTPDKVLLLTLLCFHRWFQLNRFPLWDQVDLFDAVDIVIFICQLRCTALFVSCEEIRLVCLVVCFEAPLFPLSIPVSVQWKINDIHSALCPDEMRVQVSPVCFEADSVICEDINLYHVCFMWSSLARTRPLSLSPATCVAICSRLMWVTSSNWSICSSGAHPLLWHTNM